jgi:ribosomal protein L32
MTRPSTSGAGSRRAGPALQAGAWSRSGSELERGTSTSSSCRNGAEADADERKQGSRAGPTATWVVALLTTERPVSYLALGEMVREQYAPGPAAAAPLAVRCAAGCARRCVRGTAIRGPACAAGRQPSTSDERSRSPPLRFFEQGIFPRTVPGHATDWGPGPFGRRAPLRQNVQCRIPSAVHSIRPASSTRRAHDHLKAPGLALCPEIATSPSSRTGSAPKCGYYKGKASHTEWRRGSRGAGKAADRSEGERERCQVGPTARGRASRLERPWAARPWTTASGSKGPCAACREFRTSRSCSVRARRAWLAEVLAPRARREMRPIVGVPSRPRNAVRGWGRRSNRAPPSKKDAPRSPWPSSSVRDGARGSSFFSAGNTARPAWTIARGSLPGSP